MTMTNHTSSSNRYISVVCRWLTSGRPIGPRMIGDRLKHLLRSHQVPVRFGCIRSPDVTGELAVKSTKWFFVNDPGDVDDRWVVLVLGSSIYMTGLYKHAGVCHSPTKSQGSEDMKLGMRNGKGTRSDSLSADEVDPLLPH